MNLNDSSVVYPLDGGFSSEHLRKFHHIARDKLSEDQYYEAYPLTIISPKDYVHHSIVLHRAFCSYLHYKYVEKNADMNTSPGAPMAAASFLLGDLSSQMAHPTWYVNEDLALSILENELPDDLCWGHLKIPTISAINLMFPLTPRFYRAMGDHYLPYAQIGWIAPGHVMNFLGETSVALDKTDPPQISMIYGFQHRGNGAKFGILHNDAKTLVEGPDGNDATPAHVKEVARKVRRLVGGVVMLMLHYPDLVEVGELDTPEKLSDEGEVLQRAIMKPSFIGRNYLQLKTKNDEQTHT